MKKHCILKEVSKVEQGMKGLWTQPDKLWITKLMLLLHRTRMRKRYRLCKYLSTTDYLIRRV